MVASEDLTTANLLSLWDDGGVAKVRLADSALGRAADGFCNASYTTGDLVWVYTSGSAVDPAASYTVGSLYLGAAGAVTGTPPSSGLLQRVGFATSNKTFLFQRETPIQL